MRLFVGYGYNDRDKWIKEDLLPLLRPFASELLHGKNMPGLDLDDEVKRRIEQSDACLCFLTLRVGHEAEIINTHPWVLSEASHAKGKEKVLLLVKEKGVHEISSMAPLLGNPQYTVLDPNDRLKCAREIVQAIVQWKARRLQLAPQTGDFSPDVRRQVKQSGFRLHYRTRFAGVDSALRAAALDCVKGGVFLNAIGVPDGALIEVEGRLDGTLVFQSDWEPVDAVPIPVY